MTEAEKSNGEHKPQPAHKYVDGKYVDMEIFDDYVLICGERMERKKEWTVDVATWRQQMEFLRKKLAARGDLYAVNTLGNDMDTFKKMIDAEPEDIDTYRKRMMGKK